MSRRVGRDRVTSTAQDKGTVGRVVEVLKRFAEGSCEWTLGELAVSLNLAPSTLHRLLGLLNAEGMIETHRTTKRYRPGPEFYRIAAVLAADMPIVSLSKPLLQELVEELGHTAILGLYHPDRVDMTFAAIADAPYPLRYQPPLNVSRSILWGATGRAIAAHLPDKALKTLIARRERSPRTGEPLKVRAFYADLARIRAEGVAFSIGQRTEGAVGFAAPFFTADGNVAGDIIITLPESRYNSKLHPAIVPSVRAKSRELSAKLGYRAG